MFQLSSFYRTCLDPKSLYNHGPKPLERAQHTIIVPGSKYGGSRSQIQYLQWLLNACIWVLGHLRLKMLALGQRGSGNLMGALPVA